MKESFLSANTLNVICGNRAERKDRLLNELQLQGITDYELWDGIYLPSIKKSINLAHKQIVEYAMLSGWKRVFIAEDDIQFSSRQSWEYYLAEMPEDFDIYLSMVFLGEPDQSGVVKDFTGLTLYCVAQRFYETFLATPEDEHLDRAMANLGKFVVCKPFVCRQYNGWSANTGKMENYDFLLRNRDFLGSVSV